MRSAALSLLLALTLMLTAGCGALSGDAPGFAAGSNKLKVATSFYPMYEFTQAVGGDKIDLVNLVPTGTEPHDWEPTAGHIKALGEAAVFIYNGAGMEHWLDKTLKSLDNKSLIAVEASHGFALMKGEEHDDHGDDHAEGEMDPHVWLDPQGVIHQVEQIRDALIKADAANKATYEANAAAYIEKLKAFDQEFRAGLTGCAREEFFTSHAAFGYLAHRYDLEQHPIMGLSPEAEPQPKELAEIVAEAKEHEVKHIFFETLASDKVAKMVAQEIGAQTLVLNPFEGLTDEEVKAGKNYFSVMRENLANLKIALECGK